MAPASAPQSDGQPFRGVLSPLVRKLASDNGVDLNSVTGTGTGGRITKQDVLSAASSRSKPASAPVPAQAPPLRRRASPPPHPRRPRAWMR